MKKTAISLVLALALVLCVMLVAAPQAEAAAHTGNHCVCGGTVTTGSHASSCEVKSEWQDLNAVIADANTVQSLKYTSTKSKEFYALESGNYYLSSNLDNLTYEITAKDTDGVITICLNGFTISSSAIRTVYLWGSKTLNICDCTGNGKIVSTKASDASVVYAKESASLNVYSGTLIGSQTATGAGATVRINNAETTVSVYGGTVTGGMTTSLGGNMYVCGTLNLYGGALVGGSAQIEGDVLYVNGGTVNYAGGKIVATVKSDKGIIGHGGTTAATANSDLKLGITKMGLEIAENGSVGVGYITGYTMSDDMKAKLAASSAVNNTAYGLKLWTEGGAPVYAGYADQNATAVGAHLKNIMNINDNEVNDAANAGIPVKGAAYAVIGKTVVESTTRSFTLKTLVEKMDANLTDDASLAILKDLYALYESVMSGWTLTKINAA